MRYWQPGQHLNKRKFIVEKLLGGGGYGVTYQVRDTRTNKLFAIKTLNVQRQQQENFEQLQYNFINEIIAIANCRHPNIVQVYPQVFPENELLCMVMDYIEGKDLAEYLDTTGKFPEQNAVNIITQIGEALSYVHQQGFLHRDIKPANILLRKSDSSPVLIDFGLAREYTPGSLRSMTNAKTECFAPIEQYQRNGNFGPWTDVYALAATLYVLVTAELPLPSRFRAYTPLSPPQQHNPDISDRINEAILKGIELEPENRPQSVQQWLEFLKPASASIPKVKLISDVGTGAESEIIQNISSLTIQQIELQKLQDTIKERIANFLLPNENFHTYTQLSDSLKKKKWKDADNETIQIILDLTKRKKYGSLRDKDIENISCIELLKIDLLWLEASDNRFGFSVQRHIWLRKLGLELELEQFNSSENLRDFGNCVGWYTNNELLKNRDNYKFSLDAPQGHLPSLRFPCSEFPKMDWWQSWKRVFKFFLIHTEKCSLD